MAWADRIPDAFKDSIFLIGVACIALGLLTRERGPVSRGLGMALIVVGVILAVVTPLWRAFNAG